MMYHVKFESMDEEPGENHPFQYFSDAINIVQYGMAKGWRVKITPVPDVRPADLNKALKEGQ